MKNVAQIWGIEGRRCNFLRNEANEVSRNWFEGMAFIYVYIAVKPHLSKCEMRRYDTKSMFCQIRIRNFHVNATRDVTLFCLTSGTITIHFPSLASSLFFLGQLMNYSYSLRIHC